MCATLFYENGRDHKTVVRKKRFFEMDHLNYQLKEMCKRNRDGSFATQSNRHRMLQMSADQLKELGYRGMKASSLKPKHVEALVDRWKVEGVSAGTIKNRMASLRWWAEKINKPGVVKRDNKDYGIDRRVYVTNQSKARELPESKLAEISNHLVGYSLRLQEQFGLRREESIKFNAVYADKGDFIRLKSTWTKGGKERVVPITNHAQRMLLNEIKQEIGNRSLIPDDRSFKQQLKTYEWHVSNVGLDKMHGLRHSYAQSRYEQLTGWKAPAAEGPASKSLTEHQKNIDHQVRLQISRELGHEREQITAVYLGR